MGGFERRHGPALAGGRHAVGQRAVGERGFEHDAHAVREVPAGIPEQSVDPGARERVGGAACRSVRAGGNDGSGAPVIACAPTSRCAGPPPFATGTAWRSRLVSRPLRSPPGQYARAPERPGLRDARRSGRSRFSIPRLSHVQDRALHPPPSNRAGALRRLPCAAIPTVAHRRDGAASVQDRPAGRASADPCQPARFRITSSCRA